MLKVRCMYTKQLAKKRKTWSDGYMKINLSTRKCVLIDEADYRELGLASRALEPIEMKKLENKEEFTMELAGVMVQIESAGYCAVPTASASTTKEFQPPLKLTKFVPPSTIIPKPKPPVNSFQDRQYPSSSSSSNQYGVNPSKSYRVSNDELDDIWGSSSGNAGASVPAVDRTSSSEPSRNISSVPRPSHPRRPLAEVDLESKYRPTPRPAVINGSTSDELQKLIESQWMKNSSETAVVQSESVPPDDGVWAPEVNETDYHPASGNSSNRSVGVAAVGAKVLPNGMTDFWGVSDGNDNGSEGVFNPHVVGVDSGADAAHSIHYDVGYATAALSDTAVVDESIWSFD